MPLDFEERASLILAAEDCDPAEFSQFHYFSRSDERYISKLVAHGPVLIRGGRGSGKSALMKEASRRLSPMTPDATAIGIYVSLRHLELLRARGLEYERFLCQLVITEVRQNYPQLFDQVSVEPTIGSLRSALTTLSILESKRVVLFFDDAAHIGREAALTEFFDIFRTLSSSVVSCKAAIYPGVTKFGGRFDVYNDATVMEINRAEDDPGFGDFFAQVLSIRYPESFKDPSFSRLLSKSEFARFLGIAVLGNMRSFVFACNYIAERTGGGTLGLNELGSALVHLSGNYYWPLLEELRPKLGIYEPMVNTAQSIGELVFRECADANATRTAIVLRDITERLSKPFEILEYAGFIIKRDVSRGMKSGGRGSRYAVNLCNLLEKVSGSRLTRSLFDQWIDEGGESREFHRGSELMQIPLPDFRTESALGILDLPITTLGQSNAYPYGLTQAKISVLQEAGIQTVGQLAETPDEFLLQLYYIGPAFLQRIRNVVGQAVWM